MRVLLDLHSTTKTRTGISRYWESLTVVLKKEYSNSTFITYKSTKNVYIRTFSEIKKKATEEEIDVIHVDNFVPLFTNIPTVITVHDLLFRDFPQALPRRRKIAFYLLFGYSLQRADAIICNSNFTKERLLHHFPKIRKEKIFVTHFASLSVFKRLNKSKSRSKIKNKFNISNEFFLVVGNIEKRKNIQPIIQAHNGISSKSSLVIVGEKKNRSVIIEDIIDKKRNVVFTGYISDSDLSNLYNSARGVVLNSVYEGFGLPIIESMSCGVPAICSDLPIFHELAGESVIYVKTRKEMSEAMARLLSDKEYYNKYADKMYSLRNKYSWEKTARKTYKIYQWVLRK